MTHDTFLEEIQKVIEEVERALIDRKQGVKGDGSVEQLSEIIAKLKNIKNEVQCDKLPPRNSRISSLGWFITDTWALNNPMGERIITIEQKYRKLK